MRSLHPPNRTRGTPVFPDRPAAHPVRCACRHNQQCHTYKTPPCRRPPRRKNAQPGPSASLSVYVLVWLSLKGSVAVSLPFFALLCGWSSLQPEKHPPKFSMIPLLVTLAAVTRVARRFASTGGFAFPLPAAPVGCRWISIPHFPILSSAYFSVDLIGCIFVIAISAPMLP